MNRVHYLTFVFLAIFSLLLFGGEKSFLASFPESSREEVVAANELEQTLAEYIRLEKDADRTLANFKSARDRATNKNKCCQKEAVEYLEALGRQFLFSDNLGVATGKYIDTVADSKDSIKKYEWLKKKLRKAGIDFSLPRPAQPNSPRRPTAFPSRRAVFLLKYFRNFKFWSEYPESNRSLTHPKRVYYHYTIFRGGHGEI